MIFLIIERSRIINLKIMRFKFAIKRAALRRQGLPQASGRILSLATECKSRPGI